MAGLYASLFPTYTPGRVLSGCVAWSSWKATSRVSGNVTAIIFTVTPGSSSGTRFDHIHPGNSPLWLTQVTIRWPIGPWMTFLLGEHIRRVSPYLRPSLVNRRNGVVL